MTRRGAIGVLSLLLTLACQNQVSPPLAQKNLLPDSAEQMLFTVHFKLTDGGVQRSEVRADTALAYDENTRWELRSVNTRFFDAAGKENAVLTAREGTYSMRLGSMEARGNVVVVTADGRRLETPQLRYDPSRNEISSDSAFRLVDGESVTEGIGFVSDPDMNSMRVLRALKSSGRAVTIPRR